MKTKFIYVILAALLIGSQTISAQNKDNKTNKQRPTPEQMIQRQANQCRHHLIGLSLNK